MAAKSKAFYIYKSVLDEIPKEYGVMSEIIEKNLHLLNNEPLVRLALSDIDSKETRRSSFSGTEETHGFINKRSAETGIAVYKLINALLFLSSRIENTTI